MGFFNLRTGTLRAEDAAGVGITLGPTDGDFTFSETNKENTTKTRVLDRAQYDCHIEGEDLEQTWSITLKDRSNPRTSTTAALFLDFVMQSGTFHPTTGSTQTKTVSPGANIWAFKLIYTSTLGAATGSFTLPNCVPNYSFGEALEGNTVPITGTNNGAIART